jgi:hypothetical protein
VCITENQVLKNWAFEYLPPHSLNKDYIRLGLRDSPTPDVDDSTIHLDPTSVTSNTRIEERLDPTPSTLHAI